MKCVYIVCLIAMAGVSFSAARVPPNITIMPDGEINGMEEKEIQFRTGANVFLNCSHDGDNLDVSLRWVRWEGSSKVISNTDPQKHMYVLPLGDSLGLVIKNVTDDDDFEVYCRAYNGMDMLSSSSVRKLSSRLQQQGEYEYYYEYEFEDHELKVDMLPEPDQMGMLGMDGEVNCISLENSTVIWKHNNGTNIVSGDKYDIRNGKLIIRNLEEPDAAIYVCVILMATDEGFYYNEFQIFYKVNTRSITKMRKSTTAEVAVSPTQLELTTAAVTPTTPELTTVAVTPTTPEMTTAAVTPTTPEMTTAAVTPTTPELTTAAVTPTTPHLTTAAVTPTTPELTTAAVKPTTPELTTAAVTPTTPDLTTAAVKMVTKSSEIIKSATTTAAAAASVSPKLIITRSGLTRTAEATGSVKPKLVTNISKTTVARRGLKRTSLSSTLATAVPATATRIPAITIEMSNTVKTLANNITNNIISTRNIGSGKAQSNFKLISLVVMMCIVLL